MAEEPTINEQVRAILPQADVAQLRHIAEILLDEVGYLDEHHLGEGDEDEMREGVSCTGESWHRCSGLTVHDEKCDGACGTGKPCEPIPARPWCHVAGFDCPTCGLVDELQKLVKDIAA